MLYSILHKLNKSLLIACMILFSHVSVSAGVTDLKLSTAQIFDVQWNISGGKLNASGFNYIYSSVNYSTQTTSAARWTAAQTADASANGRYIGFFNSTTNPGTYGMAVFNSDGSTYKLINNTGSFRTLADGAIFYNGNGMWGTLITTKQGYSLGASAQFTLTQEYPTNTQLQAYTPPSSTPLAAGQTAAPAGPPPPAPTAIYMNNATVKITRAIPTTSNSPPGEGPNNAFDNNSSTKYLNFDKKNAGVTVQLNTGRVVTGFTITTANDFSGRDPTSYKLYGSNDGVTWTLVKQDALTLSNNRFATSAVIDVGNTTAYAYYFMLFPTTKAGDGCGLDCDSMQIAELTYYYDANSTTTSTASSNTIVDPVAAASTPVYSSGITASQQTRKTTNLNENPLGHNAQVTIVGDDNIVNIQQIGGRHFVSVDVQGNVNNIDILQTSTVNARHYMEAKVIGGNNDLILQQRDTSKTQFVEVLGNNNSVTTNQKGIGSHYLDVRVTGNDHTAGIIQDGAGNHRATVHLSGTQPWNFNLNQNGNTSQTYSLPHTMSDGSGVNGTCSAIGGCNLTINQQ
jgi:hypothetical protein